MGSKREQKEFLIKERVFKAIAVKSGDLFTVQEWLLKYKVADSRTKIRKAIDSLVQEGRLIIEGKNISINRAEIKKARLSSGYLYFDGDSHRYYIDRDDTKGIKGNSNVLVSFYNKYINGRSVKVPFVIKEDEATNQSGKEDEVVYGRVVKTSHDELIFFANDKKRYRNPLFILNDKRTIAKYQDKICTMRVISDEKGSQGGILLEIKGEAGNPIAEYDAIAESHGAIMSFSDPLVQAEIEKLPTEVDLTGKNLCLEQDYEETRKVKNNVVVDLRNLQFTTTDPATCKDMDDAIYSTIDKSGNIVVYTAVANVTKYVKLNSEIGRRYIKAGFTTYAPNKAYNILPPELSTNICSLNPNVDRLALVIKTTLNKDGEPIESTIMDAVIKSKQKYSYEEAQAIVDSVDISKEDLRGKIQSGEVLTLDEQVIMNKVASDLLWKGLKRRYLIEFDTDNEYDVTLNEDMSDIIDINKQENCPYHKVIEAFMVTANEATAGFTLKNKIPNIYRVHDNPNEDKLERAYEFFEYLNVNFDGDLSPIGIRNIIESVKGTEKEKVVNNFLVRLQSKAKYCNTTSPSDVSTIGKPSLFKKRVEDYHGTASTKFSHYDFNSEKVSHFGLQSQHYSHTTSPIRRVPDYVTHYNILAYINGEKMLDEDVVRDIALWENQMQDAVDSAEHEIDDFNSALLCTHLIGQKMKGRICSFRKLVDRANVCASEIVVIVENEDKGIKVELPLNEVLAYKGINSKNVAISPSGSAVVNKQSGAPLLTLCQELSFTIANSNRVTRQVSGSMYTSSEKIMDTIDEITSRLPVEEKGSVFGAKSRKVERMLQNREYCKNIDSKHDKQEESHLIYGLKFKNQIDYSDFTEEMENDEAYRANKNQSKDHKQRKMRQKEQRKREEYHNECDIESEDDEKY